ncbi:MULTISPECIES: gephyrin-like molybdotransferase Glp [unclassified Variovorax]|uniref:molybdopterin molybdotransferase MoeA n=1 Tax=unclassified Variovorax TaxID=663243 RepID=UPI0008D5062C|nr:MULTISPECIES: gephyrin-like molybdotransferase Glp [unclassified Variovorax]SEJ31213.1 molybdopterin molybdotransferase [Variovorax sp. OK202]SFC25818.1 molybdopterin molybdotransferase [Variovorax sp. OK212]
MADTPVPAPVPFSASSLRPPLMPLDEAIAVLLAKATPVLPAESVGTFDADGRVLAQDLVSGLTVPPRDNSAMDGYAVRVADCAAPGAELTVAQRIPAGTVGTALAAGTAARIFTGAQIPEGADAVVMQEDTAATPQEGSLGSVRIAIVPAAGQWVRRAGEDVASGDVVLRQGERLTPAALGLAASVGFDRLQVARKPRVAMLSTGDELVMPGEVTPDAMKPGAIYNSNRFFMRALLHRLGCEVNDLGIVPDNREATIAALRDAAESSDLIITTGGVSVGEEDHIRAALQSLGELQLWSLSMKPGKPFAYGSIARGNGQGACHVTGLPGNPVSSFLTFLMLVRPFLLTLQGATRVAPEAVQMRADFDWLRADKRREFLRARRNAAGGLELFGNQSSGVLTSMVWGDGVVDNPAGHTIRSGDTVDFIPFASLLG